MPGTKIYPLAQNGEQIRGASMPAWSFMKSCKTSHRLFPSLYPWSHWVPSCFDSELNPVIRFDQWDISQHDVSRGLQKAYALSLLAVLRTPATSTCEEAQASLLDDERHKVQLLRLPGQELSTSTIWVRLS